MTIAEIKNNNNDNNDTLLRFHAGVAADVTVVIYPNSVSWMPCIIRRNGILNSYCTGEGSNTQWYLVHFYLNFIELVRLWHMALSLGEGDPLRTMKLTESQPRFFSNKVYLIVVARWVIGFMRHCHMCYKIIMMVADDLVPIWRQGICNHGGDVGRSASWVPGVHHSILMAYWLPASHLPACTFINDYLRLFYSNFSVKSGLTRSMHFCWRSASLRRQIVRSDYCIVTTLRDTDMLSFWRTCHHWLRWFLSS